jgi:hypothetical protein
MGFKIAIVCGLICRKKSEERQWKFQPLNVEGTRYEIVHKILRAPCSEGFCSAETRERRSVVLAGLDLNMKTLQH